MRIRKGEKVLFAGDSITSAGRSYPVGEGAPGALGDGYVALFDARLKARHPALRVRVVNMGDKGQTSRDLLGRWQRDVLDLSPDRVVLQVGANDAWRRFDRALQDETHVSDAEYAANLEELILRTKPAVKELVLIAPFYLDARRDDPMRAAMDRLGDLVKDAARRHGLACVDAQAAVDRLLSHFHPVFFAFDRVHPSLVGHEALAAAVYEAFGGVEPDSAAGLSLAHGGKLLFVGDSITDCERARRYGEGSPGSLGKGYVHLVDAILQTRRPDLRIRTVNMGVSGDSTRDLLARWQEDVLDLAPDHVVMMIGINDCARAFHRPYQREAQVGPAEFAENLDRLVRTTLPAVKSMALAMPFFLEPDRNDGLRAASDEFGEILRRTAERFGLRCFDTQAAFDRILAHVPTYELAPDRVHPGWAGHFAIAEGMLAIL